MTNNFRWLVDWLFEVSEVFVQAFLQKNLCSLPIVFQCELWTDNQDMREEPNKLFTKDFPVLEVLVAEDSTYGKDT